MWQDQLVAFLLGLATAGAGVALRNRIRARVGNTKPPKDHSQ